MLWFYLSLLDTPEKKSKLEKIYYEYRKPMLYIAHDILHDYDKAEDAVQQGFLKIISHLDKIEDISCHKTKSFIVLIIRCISLDMLRKENKRMEVYNEDIPEWQMSCSDVEDSLLVEDIVEELKRLPDIYRDILELKVYHGLSEKEIANTLEISYATVRKRLERARNMLVCSLKK